MRRTFSLKQLRRQGTQLDPEDVEALGAADRPRTRADCLNSPRPCPFVSCKHHLALDVTPCGSLKVNAPDIEAMVQSCVLDVADDGPVTLERAGELLGVSRQRAQQIQEVALTKVRAKVER